MNNKAWTNDEIKNFIRDFELGIWPESQWNHEEHLIMCLYYLTEFPHYEAALKIKLGIINYNNAVGLKNTLERGYHETMTLFWIWSLDSFLKSELTQEMDFVAKIKLLLDSPFSKKYLPLFFYSEDLLFSSKARLSWVDPDLNPLNATLITAAYPDSIWFG